MKLISMEWRSSEEQGREKDSKKPFGIEKNFLKLSCFVSYLFSLPIVSVRAWVIRVFGKLSDKHYCMFSLIIVEYSVVSKLDVGIAEPV